MTGTVDIKPLISAITTTDISAFDGELNAVRAIAARHPNDPGVVVAPLMNFVELRRGQALYAPAGTLHAYLSGLGVEVTAVSDSVLRGGLTSKHVDVSALVRVLDATPHAPNILGPIHRSSWVHSFSPDIPDFRVLQISSVRMAPTQIAISSPSIIVVTEGPVTIGSGRDEIVLTPGRAAFSTAKSLCFTGDGTAFLAEKD